jgi:hypothetical protein
LAFRKLVSDVKKEAEYYSQHEDPALNNGLSKEEIDWIVSDSETQYRAGDRAKDEQSNEQNYCTVLLKMWPQDGTIYARKSTQSVVFRKDWNTDLHRYPLASMQWTPRKNSCHGEAEATELIPNNIAINKLMATMILWTMLNAYPKAIYDNQRIKAWSNNITQAIPVEGDIQNVAMYLQPNGLPACVQNLFELLVQTTKDMAGANETALGDNSITKTAAGIIALQKATELPMSPNKRRFAQWVEDIGLIWLDFWLSKYTVGRVLMVERKNPETKQDETVPMTFDGSLYNQYTFGLKIDVGASTQWSEVASIQTLDALLEKGLINFKQYLERQYSGLIPKRQELIDDIEEQEQQAQMQTEEAQAQMQIQALEAFISKLSPELQAAIQQESQMMVGGAV